MHILFDSIVFQVFYALWTIVIPILFYKFSLKHMFLFLLGRCANAKFFDKFMCNFWGNCHSFPRHFPFPPQRLMVLFSHIPANIRHFSFASDSSSVCMRWAGMCDSSPPTPTFFSEVLLLSGDMLNLTFIYTWAPSLSPFPSGVLLSFYFPLQFLGSNLFCVHLFQCLLLLIPFPSSP